MTDLPYVIVRREPTDDMLNNAQSRLCELANVTYFNDHHQAEMFKAMCVASPSPVSLEEIVEALRKLVRDAYSEGFSEGMREHTSHRGGKTWQESSTAAALSKMEPSHG